MNIIWISEVYRIGLCQFRWLCDLKRRNAMGPLARIVCPRSTKFVTVTLMGRGVFLGVSRATILVANLFGADLWTDFRSDHMTSGRSTTFKACAHWPATSRIVIRLREACPLKSADLNSLDYIAVGAYIWKFKKKLSQRRSLYVAWRC